MKVKTDAEICNLIANRIWSWNTNTKEDLKDVIKEALFLKAQQYSHLNTEYAKRKIKEKVNKVIIDAEKEAIKKSGTDDEWSGNYAFQIIKKKLLEFGGEVKT